VLYIDFGDFIIQFDKLKSIIIAAGRLNVQQNNHINVAEYNKKRVF